MAAPSGTTFGLGRCSRGSWIGPSGETVVSGSIFRWWYDLGGIVAASQELSNCEF